MHYLISNINTYNNDSLTDFYKKIYKDKKIKINKFKIINRKKQSIIGEILLKDLLKKFYNLNYEELHYKINNHGKPYILNTNVFFNISHSNEYVITVISTKEIGVDIEKIHKTNINTIYQFATKNEIKYILSSSQNIKKRLFEIYTLKEAYFKMNNTSLKNLKQIEFTILKDTIICNDKKIKAKLIHKINNYIIAICEKK